MTDNLEDVVEELDPPEPTPEEYSDEALALEFASRHADTLRYVAEWGVWLEWDGTVWREDRIQRAFLQARHICRKTSEGALLTLGEGKAHIARSIASAQKVVAVAKLAGADARLAATADIWDRHADLLATPDGVVDLVTGELTPADPALLTTKTTAVGPAAPEAEHPLWSAFLTRVCAGDNELIAFLQRMAGYCLTGDVSEHALFFLYGTGRNGKGVFINTLSKILAEYASTAAMHVFTEQKHTQHSTDIAMLRGARLVTAQETEEGKRWAAALIKQVTGGDPITARRMRRDPFTFNPQFKLVFAGNHKPALRTVDEAMRARVHLIPFTETIPLNERDPRLPEKLEAEWPAILRWAIEGCVAWRERGLDPPEAVRGATDAYMAEEDAIGRWIAECCKRSPRAHTSSAALYASWRAWAEASGESVGSQKRLSQELTKRGFHAQHVKTGHAGFEGLDVVYGPISTSQKR